MLKNNINKEIIKYIFFILAIFLIQLTIDICIENYANEAFKFFKPYKHLVGYALLIALGLWGRNEIHNLYKKEIELRDDKLKDESKIIWEKYHDLHEFKKNEAINKNLEEFVLNEPQVIAIQIYSYNSFINRFDLFFKINHKFGFIEEGNSINAIMQEYFKIKKSVYRKYIKAIKSKNPINLLNFIDERVKTFKSKNFKSLTEYNCSDYHITKMATESLLENSGLDIKSIISEDFEKHIEKMKRGGIFRGILTSDYYYFESKKDLKKNRVYLTKRVAIDNKSHIILITLHKDIALKDDKLYEIGNRYLKGLSQLCTLDIKGGVDNDKHWK